MIVLPYVFPLAVIRLLPTNVCRDAVDELGMKAAIQADPSLATCRSVNRSALPMDGWTPLHLAAARGNLRFVEVRSGFAFPVVF